MKAVDLTGQRFGRLLVNCAETVQRKTCKRRLWLCICDCGRSVRMPTNRLTSGDSRSCGCAKKRLAGLGKRSPEYAAWCAMRQRVKANPLNNPKHYVSYSGRGIAVCERWNDFAAFLADVGSRPSAKYSLDRIDVNGNYEPGNVRWATQSEQQNNRRDTIKIELGGEVLTMVDLEKRTGVRARTLYRRIVVDKIPVHEALGKQLPWGAKRKYAT